MTENKRFKIVDEQFISYYGGTGYKISNEECGFWLWHNKNESQKVCDKLNSILDENEQLKQFQEQVASVIEGKMGDNVCNDYKMEVLKEIWNELELDEVWFE